MSHKPEVALAILHQNNRFLLQLRDDLPSIVHPGHWALFGGHIEPDEDSDTAIRRELLEEIGHTPAVLLPFCRHADGRAVRYIYVGQLEVPLEALILGEGADLALLSPEDIKSGTHYSSRVEQVRPLAPFPQQILLNFIARYSAS